MSGALDGAGLLAWRVLALVPLRPAPPGPPGSERGEEFGKTSPIALVVILLLGLATVLLIRSMNKRLRNVPASFDDPPGGAPAVGGAGDAGTDADDDRPDAPGRPRAGPTGSP